MVKKLHTAFGIFVLRRWPVSSDQSLQAWDAADELVLAHLDEQYRDALTRSPSVLICNDANGALSCALHHHAPVIWSDSCLSHQSVRRNWQTNNLPNTPDCLESMNSPVGKFDIVVVKVPKAHALLEDQLIKIRPLLHEKSVVIAASLVRHLQRSAIGLIEKYLGSVSTSLAVKKARLVFCTPDMSRAIVDSPYPDSYHEPELNVTLGNHANLFCRDRLDMGARFFLQHLDKLPQANTIIDLACGNGVLGICIQQRQPQAQIQFIDESYMAVDSARSNYHVNVSQPISKPVFLTGNGLHASESNAAQLIVCNPPFHTQHTITADTARDFFKHSARVLNSGELWVVANRHLRYRHEMLRHFRQCDIVASNPKFVLFRAKKPLP